MTGKDKGQGRIEGIKGGSEESPVQKIIKHFENYQTPVRRHTPEAEPQRADTFRQGGRLQRFLTGLRKRMDGRSGYARLRLPGTSYFVRDLRRKGARDTAAGKEADYQMREGRLSKAKKSYVNYLGDRSGLQTEKGKMDKEISRLLSKFEKLLVERFEKGKTIAQKSKDGKPHFKLKTVKEWRSFFSKFFKRSIWKKAEMKVLKQFIYRGLVSLKKGGGSHAMLIGDMAMMNGQVEKFARLRVLAELMEIFSKMEPGATVEQELIRRGIGAEDIRYLALAHKHAEQAVKTGAETTKGIFGELKAEERAAEHLGLRRRKKGGGYGGPIKWGDKDDDDEHAFVPLGFWERQKRPEYRRIAILIYTIIAIAIIIGVYSLIKNLF